MKKTKRGLTFVLSLMICITLIPLGVSADSEIIKDTDIISEEVVEEMPDFIEYKGEIVEVIVNEHEGEKQYSIFIKNDKEAPYNGMIFHLSDNVVILNNKTKDFVAQDSFSVGMIVSGYYDKDTIMTMSLPAQLSPDVIIVNESEAVSSVRVTNFDKDLLSADGSLKIDISEETVIIDKEGNELKKEDILNKDLVIFYNMVKESYPAQTTPEKIIVIENTLKIFDKMFINGKDFKLDVTLYKKGQIIMVPLRKIAEELGYVVTWNNDTRAAELIKGAQWTSVVIGEDNYSFAKMIVKLGTAPEINNSSTFVPLSFLEEVLQAEVKIAKNGLIEVTQ